MCDLGFLTVTSYKTQAFCLLSGLIRVLPSHSRVQDQTHRVLEHCQEAMSQTAAVRTLVA